MRRMVLALALFSGLIARSAAQDEEAAADPRAMRYGLPVTPLTYPQAKPEEALKSVVRALDRRRFDYLLAHLADPRLVDSRVAEYRSAISAGTEQARTFLGFDRLQRETELHYIDDPQLLRELRLLARDAEWEVNENQAAGSAKDIPHKVFLRKLGDRWFLETRQQ